MAPITAHLIIAARLFPVLGGPRGPHPDAYGAFLLGNGLGDLQAFPEIDRAPMPFAARMGTGGANTFERSCENFLGQLDHLLVRPWAQLNKEEQAFVTGYYCHLAADKDEKLVGLAVWAVLAVGHGDCLNRRSSDQSNQGETYGKY